MLLPILILSILSVILYFLILYILPKFVALGHIKVFSDFTDSGATFILNIFIVPFYIYAIYMGIEKFIWGYSFLFFFLFAYNLHFAYKYNRSCLQDFMVSFITRLCVPAVDAIFFGVNLWVFLKYTVSMGLSLKILWGFCLFSIAFFITLISLLNLVSDRRFSNVIAFVKNFNK